MKRIKLGCLPSVPDPRDYEVCESPEFPTPEKIQEAAYSGEIVGDGISFRDKCSPVEDQGSIGSCTAQAIAGAAEYLQAKDGRPSVNLSRMFLYRNARRLGGIVGDNGAHVRDGFKALVRLGCPEETYWPYDEEIVDEEPDAFCFSMAHAFKALRYFRCDVIGRERASLLALMTRLLDDGVPIVLGFSLFNWGSDGGVFEVPILGERPLGAHAVMLTGYSKDDLTGPYRGGFEVRNSWGTDWGDAGYGCLPFEYVLRGLVWDVWCLRKVSYGALR